MSSKGARSDSFGWNTVRGRQRPRFSEGQCGFKHGFKQQQKRQRTSTESGSGGSISGDTSKVDFEHGNELSIDEFKNMNIDNKLDTLFVYLCDVKSTNQRLLKAEKTVHDIHESTKHNSDRIETLAYRSIDLEARQRRNNLIFWGIPEVRMEDCLTLVADFLADHLDLDPERICIQRAHRVGKLSNPRRSLIGQATNKPKHRPLIALFCDYQDVELILGSAKKLKGKGFGINRDYPPEIIAARKPLFAEKKNLQLANPNSKLSIQYPAKLFMDGRLIKDAFPAWQDSIRKSRLDSITLPTGKSHSRSGPTPRLDSRPVSVSVSPTPNRQSDRVRLSDKIINRPIEPDVFADDSSSDMEQSPTDDPRDKSPITTVQADVHIPGQPHLVQPGYVDPAGDLAGGTSIHTNDIEADTPPDPPGEPAWDSIDPGHD